MGNNFKLIVYIIRKIIKSSRDLVLVGEVMSWKFEYKGALE